MKDYINILVCPICKENNPLTYIKIINSLGCNKCYIKYN